MIIGKNGDYVARVQHESSARVQVLPANDDNSLSERVVTIQGMDKSFCMYSVSVFERW